MSSHVFGARHAGPRSGAALDFGLRVRLPLVSEQKFLFAGASELSVQELTSELAEHVASLRSGASRSGPSSST